MPQPRPEKGRTAQPRRVLRLPLQTCLNHRVPLLKVKENIARSLISDYNGTQSLQKLGCSVAALSVGEISAIPWEAFKELQKNITVRWTRCQMRALVEKKLGGMKVTAPEPPESRILPPGFPSHSSLRVSQCKNVSHQELMELQSLVGGLPCCVLKHIKAHEVLNHSEALLTISKQMKKAQLKALLQGVSNQRRVFSTTVQDVWDARVCKHGESLQHD